MSTPNKVEVSQVSEVTTVEITTAGPQGPSSTINSDNAVDNSIVYYHQSSGTFKADATTTKLTLVDGGNF
tara:strand:- start:1084 stop:1293 length:210 start_codon:yes stop_codon:yes gene_type:complete